MLLYFVDKDPARPFSNADINDDAKRGAFLAACWLSHADGPHAQMRTVENNSPSGKPGIVLVFPNCDLTAAEQVNRVGVWQERQDWVRCAGGKYWCGKPKGEPVTPESLRRDDNVPGFHVELSDGNKWEVARALYQNGRQGLTRRLSLNVDGKVLRGHVIDRFAALDEEAGKFFTAWMLSVEENRATEYMLDDLMRLAVMGLQANYRIGIDEAVGLLGLFDEENVWDACLATISWPSVMAMAKAETDAQKKTEEAGTPNG